MSSKITNYKLLRGSSTTRCSRKLCEVKCIWYFQLLLYIFRATFIVYYLCLSATCTLYWLDNVFQNFAAKQFHPSRDYKINLCSEMSFYQSCGEFHLRPMTNRKGVLLKHGCSVMHLCNTRPERPENTSSLPPSASVRFFFFFLSSGCE